MSQEETEDHSKKILKGLETKDELLLDDEKNLHGLILRLESKNMITYKLIEENFPVLTDEGKNVVQNGSPEFLYFENLVEGKEAEKNIGLNYAMKNKWVKIENKRVYKIVDHVNDEISEILKLVKAEEGPAYSDKLDDKQENKSFDQDIPSKAAKTKEKLSEVQINMLKKRKLVTLKKTKKYSIAKGSAFNTKMREYATELTSDMLVNEKYRDLDFKVYNFNTKIKCESGNLHPLMKVKSEVKMIFLELGFSEMPTSRYVESSFWNFDALFQPQNHPSRELQDTFFIANPAKTKMTPTNYTERVKDIHEKSYKNTWSHEESLKNVLRTHTTACTARMLYEAGQNPEKMRPMKLFSIDRVFRNESVDATHLAEFHQIEGMVLGKNLTIGHLMGVLKDFFEKLNLTNIKFKPAFNPYTEPSLEIFAFHEKLNRWIEIGNSGVFRPEVLEPMGIKDDWRVIAWGLSLERPAMIKYNLDNIRDLLGHKADLEFIKNSTMCYF